MIRARIRYTNGATVVRQGTALIDACLAAGLKIVNDPANRGLEGIYGPQHFETEEEAPEVKKKRPRVSKNTA